jgi:hypothetical protein
LQIHAFRGKPVVTDRSQPFGLSPSADTIGITIMDEVELPPALLVRHFGAPGAGDGYKVSGQYVFSSQSREPFVVHDWKGTSLWEGGLPQPSVFWRTEEPAEFAISTRDQDTDEFKQWLNSRLGIEK